MYTVQCTLYSVVHIFNTVVQHLSTYKQKTMIIPPPTKKQENSLFFLRIQEFRLLFFINAKVYMYKVQEITFCHKCVFPSLKKRELLEDF